MKEDVKNFVIEYNTRMIWNKDIINKYGEKNIPQDIIDDHLTTEPIDEENYDLENAKLYEYTDDDAWKGTIELQAYSNKRCYICYFWLKPSDTEEIYKDKKIEKIKGEVEKRCHLLFEKITSLTSELKQFSEFNTMLNFESVAKNEDLVFIKNAMAQRQRFNCARRKDCERENPDTYEPIGSCDKWEGGKA